MHCAPRFVEVGPRSLGETKDLRHAQGFLYRAARLVTFPFPAACLALCAGFRPKKAESSSILVAVCFMSIPRSEGAILL